MNAPDFISMAEQMQRVLAFRRQQAHAISTSARLELLATLQQQAFNSMHSNPAAVEACVRRITISAASPSPEARSRNEKVRRETQCITQRDK
ncbi:MAG: hypothetical protein KDA51_20915 [Planctomycetales bacterium]|nr:hypothetical protein [Planctomycetales bacterium]